MTSHPKAQAEVLNQQFQSVFGDDKQYTEEEFFQKTGMPHTEEVFFQKTGMPHRNSPVMDDVQVAE